MGTVGRKKIRLLWLLFMVGVTAGMMGCGTATATRRILVHASDRPISGRLIQDREKCETKWKANREEQELVLGHVIAVEAELQALYNRGVPTPSDRRLRLEQLKELWLLLALQAQDKVSVCQIKAEISELDSGPPEPKFDFVYNALSAELMGREDEIKRRGQRIGALKRGLFATPDPAAP